MNQIKKKLDGVMADLKKQNPNANWKNLLTGLMLLILVGVFSYWYFSGNAQDTDALIDEISKDAGLVFVDEDDTNSGDANSDAAAEDSSGEQATDAMAIDENGMATVLAGEGLWDVAERVCGDGEKYNHIAAANNLSVRWAKLAVGQMLYVDCGTK